MKKAWIIPAALLASAGIGYALWKKNSDRWMRQRIERLPGNGPDYGLQHITPLEDSPLKGKRILFLGSSITEGYGGCSVSFADYLEKKHGILAAKEAVCGTTLADIGKASYVQRLLHADATHPWDLLVCQLSTNDASRRLPLGIIAETKDPAAFSTDTIAGALEWILAYAEINLHCPVVFYTNPRYESVEYSRMVRLLYQLRQKWEFSIIDLWNDEKFNEITSTKRQLYMADRIHPTQAGYLRWWLPKFEAHLQENVNYGNVVNDCLNNKEEKS